MTANIRVGLFPDQPSERRFGVIMDGRTVGSWPTLASARVAAKRLGAKPHISERNFQRLTTTSASSDRWSIALDSRFFTLCMYLELTATVDASARKRLERLTSYLDTLEAKVAEENQAHLETLHDKYSDR